MACPISVVMPAYNASAYIAEAIRSVLLQTSTQFELIVVIDAWTDDCSREIAESVAGRDPRVIVRSSGKHGLSQNLNDAISLAQGRYIALCDADDVLQPTRLADQLAYMQANDLDVAGGCAECFGAATEFLWFPEAQSTICKELLFRSSLLPSTVMARTEVMKENPYDDGYLLQDYELLARLVLRYKIANMQQILARRRMHPKQMTIVNARTNRFEKETVRRDYFYRLFPKAVEAEYSAFAKIADGLPFQSLDEARLGGVVFERLADDADPFYRSRLARKWRHACRLSAFLGPACGRAYTASLRRAGWENDSTDWLLHALCAARTGSNSRLAKVSRAFMRRWTGPADAVT